MGDDWGEWDIGFTFDQVQIDLYTKIAGNNTVKETIKYENYDDLKKARVIMNKYVEPKLAAYYDNDVGAAFRQLEDIPELLAIALGTSSGFSCNEPITKISTKYKTVIVDSRAYVKDFSKNILNILKQHNTAFSKSYGKAPTKCARYGVKVLNRCSAYAEELSKIASQMSARCNELVLLTDQGLVASAKDCSNQEALHRQVTDKMAQIKAKVAADEESIKALQEDIQYAKEQEVKAKQEVSQLKQHALISSLVNMAAGIVVNVVLPIVAGAVGGPMAAAAVGGAAGAASGAMSAGQKPIQGMSAEQKQQQAGLENQRQAARTKMNAARVEQSKKMRLKANENDKAKADKLQTEIDAQQKVIDAAQKEYDSFQSQIDALVAGSGNPIEQANAAADKAAASRRKMQREKLEANARVKSQLAELASANEQKNFLKAAIAALGVCQSTLGKIKVIFMGIEKFWGGVAQQTKTMGRVEFEFDDSDDDGFDIWRVSIVESSSSWLALGSMTIEATEALEEINAKTNKVFNAIPGKDQAASLVKKAQQSIEAKAKEEDKMNKMVIK